MPRLLLGLFLSLNLSLTSSAQTVPELHVNQSSAEAVRLSAAINAFEIENLQRLKIALDGLPFRAGLVIWPCVPTECGSGLPGVELSGPGIADAATVERMLVAAGFNPATTHVHVTPAPIFPPVSPLPWPLKGEVVAPGMVSATRPMTIQVRLTSQTFLPATVYSGLCPLDAVVLDEQGHTATWLGQEFCPEISLQLPLPAWGTAELTGHIDLNQFNPHLPLAPGKYTLRVQVKRVDASLGTFGDALYGLKPTDWAVTLPDVTFEILP